MIKKFGGERLGSGNKMNVELHNFERSTHNLSHAWRSSMAPGVLVPFLNQIGLNGDTFDIDLSTLVRTLPTVNPLFGSFKMQMDIFQVPMRLYNGILHNNPVQIGLEMNKVYIPKAMLSSSNLPTNAQADLQQISPTSLLHYLGLKGLQAYGSTAITGQYTLIKKIINAMPILAYYDIFKNYYANKQEKKCYCIAPDISGKTEKIQINPGLTEVYRYEENEQSLYQYTPKQYWINYLIPQTQTNDQWTLVTKTGAKINRLKIDTHKKYLSSLTFEYTITGNKDIIRLSADNDFIYDDEINHIYAELNKGILTFSTLETNVFIEAIKMDFTQYSKIDLSGKTKTDLNSIRDKVAIKSFNLTDIDDMRRYLLGRNQLGQKTEISEAGIPLYNNAIGAVADGYINNNSFTMNGLALKTYQSDMFTNWLDSEQIIGNSGINEITKIVPDDDGGFTMDTFILANKIYNMLNRIAVSGGTYEDWQEAVYGEEALRHAESPIYCGGASCEVTFEEVVSNAATDDQALGSLAGKGTQTNVKGGHVQIHVKEPSIIMGIVSLTPRVDYYQGNDWQLNLDTYDDLHKPSLDQIGFQDLMGETLAWFDMRETHDDPEVTLSYGKQPAWLHYMTAVNELHGDFCEENKAQTMVLARKFNSLILEELNDIKTTVPEEWERAKLNFTSYINPTEYNYAFADSSLTAQNFWVQIGIGETVRRKMSAKIMPNL